MNYFIFKQHCFLLLGRPTGRPRPVYRPAQWLSLPASEPVQAGARPGNNPSQPGQRQRLPASRPAQAGASAGRGWGARWQPSARRRTAAAKQREGEREEVSRGTAGSPGNRCGGRRGEWRSDGDAACVDDDGRRQRRTGRRRRLTDPRSDSFGWEE